MEKYVKLTLYYTKRILLLRTMNSAPAIGIDLGTTFSLAAVYRNKNVEVIPNADGQRLTPSTVFYHPDSLEVIVGSTADDMQPLYPENVLYDQKRIIGRLYADAYVQKLKDKKQCLFNIVRGEDEKAEVELVHDGVKVQKSPEQACSEILKYLRNCASEYLGANVTEAVISVPAYFSNAQRKATKAAAELAGLKLLKLITEPVAGAIYYAKDRLKTQSTLLVFDFGGGTLDVSIIEVNEKTFEVKSVEGDTFLGGRDFDQILVEYFMPDILKIIKDGQNYTRTINRLKYRVPRNCKNLKQKLSTIDNYSLLLELSGDIEYKLTMSQAKFEQLTMNLMERSLNLVDKCLKEAGLSKADINDVILVGGTTRIPKIRDMLSSYFNQNNKTDLNPDEAVAQGAAIQAAYLKSKYRELEKYKITEVTPLSIGLGLSYDLTKFFIKKNTPLPVKSKPIRFCTLENNQTNCIFEIFEGERKNCKYNNFLGSFSIYDFPKRTAGEIVFETIFSLNEDGILEVEAFETISGKRNKLVRTMEEYRLCESTIKNFIQDAENNEKDDEIFEIFVGYKMTVLEHCKHILYYLNDIPFEVDRDLVEEKCNTFKDFVNNLEYTKINHLRAEYKIFREAVNPFISDYNIAVVLLEDNIIFDANLL